MSKQRGWLIALLLVLLACILSVACAACGLVAWRAYGTARPTFSDGRGQEGTQPKPVQPGGTQGPTAVPARRAGELRLAGAEPVTLDPALVQDSYSSGYVVEIFSGLVTLDRDLAVAPDLAERWEVSDDGRTYTFHLRQDAAFQDGRKVTAADVKYSLERACSPEVGSRTAASYLGDIEGALAMMQGEAKELSGLQVLDEYTLALTIDAPKSYFLAKLTYPTAFVVDSNNVGQGPDWTDHPNGTGPFRLAERTSDRIVLERNTNYYGGAPALERVTYVLSGGSPMTMYENGQLDIVQVGLADIERVQDPANPLSAELTIVPQLDVQYLAMNVETPPFDDVKVRQAFAHAIDRRRLADVVWKKTVVPAGGILPPGLPGYREDFAGLAFDPELAVRCLQESRYKDAADLPEVMLYISGSGGSLPPTVEAIVAMLRTNLGVEVKVQETPWDRFLADLNDRRYGLFSSGWIADYPDPQNFLDILFHGESPDNHSAYANPDVDRLLEQARIEQNAEARLKLYQQAEDAIVQDAVWVPLWHSRDYTLTKPYVKGVVYSASIRPWLKDAYIAP